MEEGSEGMEGTDSSRAETSSPETTTDGEPMTVDAGDVLTSVALQVVVPTMEAFVSATTELEAATSAHLADITATPDDAAETLATTQDAFRRGMEAWQMLEVMQIGPAGAEATVLAGESLRDEIYSWPSVSTCRIDQRIADEGYAADDFFSANLINAYGIAALEYLVFEHGSDHTCAPQVQLDGPWTALGVVEIERRRSAYAQVLAQELLRRASDLASRWSPDGGNFAGALASPGEGTSPYPDETTALNEIFRAMFYVDKLAKDAKVGRALGIADGCAAVPCPDLFESPYAGLAGPALVANLRGLQQLVTGGADPATSAGFDDLLVAAGQPEIAESLLADIAATITLIEGIGDTTLQALVGSDMASVQAIYDAIKRITDTLKGPFVMTLRLSVPSEGGIDND